MKRLQRFLALLIGKALFFLLRLLKAGGGTTLPGRVALKLYPELLTDLSSRLPEGVILVTGTNGKTTTTRMISEILTHAGYKVLHNRAGANLVTGVASAMVQNFSLWGKTDRTIGLFEVDEAHLPGVIKNTRPRRVIIHNLFRDQLDRYGEIDTLLKKWKEGLSQLPLESLLLLNGDDPGVASLAQDAKTICYGMENPNIRREAQPEHTADSQFCKKCGSPLAYEQVYYGHIGSYRCPKGDFEKPTLTYRGQEFTSLGMEGLRLNLAHGGGSFLLETGLPGLYNGYNVLAAASLALSLHIQPEIISETLHRFSSAFGRLEKVSVGDKSLVIALIKNPVGTNEVLRLLTESSALKDYLIIINDRIADGTDVSWLWDADFELLSETINSMMVSGTRAHDMALRLKYGDIPPEKALIEPAIQGALERALENLPSGKTLHILATYTAMLELQEVMVRKKFIDRPYWER